MEIFRKKHLRYSALMGVFTWAFASSFATAQIKIGHTSGITGAVAASVAELRSGARLYIDSINEAGGIRGEKIEWIEIDDQFKPELAQKNANTLVKEKGAIALFLPRGTPHTEAIMKDLGALQVPVLAPSTGARTLHEPVNPWVFNVRSTYQIEAERAIALMNRIGLESVGVVHVDDSFGADGVAGLNKGFVATNTKPVFQMKYDRTKPDFAPVIAEIVRTKPQAVFIVGSGSVAADLIKGARAAGSVSQFATLSNNASNGFIKQLGEFGRGVIVSQVYPSEETIAFPIVAEANRLAKAKGLERLSPANMEGYAAAKVLVAGLQKTKGKPTAESLRAALDSLTSLDIGGLKLGFSPTDHSGFDYVDLSIISKNGRFMR
jgi:branched-chain amino acid transport system substrate-binding protein